MSHEKQLRVVKLEEVLQKRQLDQALNAKEFAVLAGISYSTAREWFRLPGFPIFRRVVFWQDFVHWRSAQNNLGNPNGSPSQKNTTSQVPPSAKSGARLPPCAARILAEAG
jgi:hypothetical protein